MADLLGPSELPEGFAYPREFLRVAELGLRDLDPWLILDGAHVRIRFVGIQQRYPQRRLVPFARRQDNDDVACFDLDTGNVSVIHDFASPGWEQRENSSVFADFRAWLHQAIEDLIDH